MLTDGVIYCQNVGRREFLMIVCRPVTRRRRCFVVAAPVYDVDHVGTLDLHAIMGGERAAFNVPLDK